MCGQVILWLFGKLCEDGGGGGVVGLELDVELSFGGVQAWLIVTASNCMPCQFLRLRCGLSDLG